MASRALELSAPWILLALGRGCGWEGLEAISTQDASVQDASVVDAADDDATAADSSTEDVLDAGPPPPPTGPCTAPGPYVASWSFDAGVGAWSLMLDPDVEAGLTWTGAVGDPTLGALQVDVAPASTDAGQITGAWVEVDQDGDDFADKTGAAWVWLEKGTAPHLKMFAQTGSQYVWADNGTLFLPARAWTCISLPFSQPSYQQASYDPTDVIRVGFEMLGVTPFRLYVSSVHVR